MYIIYSLTSFRIDNIKILYIDICLCVRNNTIIYFIKIISKLNINSKLIIHCINLFDCCLFLNICLLKHTFLLIVTDEQCIVAPVLTN